MLHRSCSSLTRGHPISVGPQLSHCQYRCLSSLNQKKIFSPHGNSSPSSLLNPTQGLDSVSNARNVYLASFPSVVGPQFRSFSTFTSSRTGKKSPLLSSSPTAVSNKQQASALALSQHNLQQKRSYSSNDRRGPFSLLNDRIYIKLRENDYTHSPLQTVNPYVDGDRAATLALFWLVAANIFLYFFFKYFAPVLGLKHFTLTRENILSGRLYVLLTHAFNHESVLHLLLNMYVLISFGKPFLYAKGLNYVAKVYALSCLGGGAVASMVLLQNSHMFSRASGSSTGICGIFATCALMNPHAGAGIVLLPFTFKMINLLYAFIAVEFLRLVMLQDPAAGGHLGGIAAGALCVMLL